MYKVLFLCVGNSARSQMAEALLNNVGGHIFEAYSAGSNPSGVVHPQTIKQLKKNAYPIEGMYSKSMFEYMGKVQFDFVITLCDEMVEECPVFPEKPHYIHWGLQDPAAFVGDESETEAFFERIFKDIGMRINLLLTPDYENLTYEEVERLLVNR